MIRANFHTHTTFCDGTSTAEEMAEQALHLGFHTLGFSGHMDADIQMDLPAYRAEIRRIQEKYRGKLDVLMGMELDSLYDPKAAEGMEYVIGSTHFLKVEAERPMAIDASEEITEELCDRFFAGDYYRMARAYYDLEAEVVDRTHCDIIGHYDLISRFNDKKHYFDEEDPRYYQPALEVMESLVKKEVPFEINCGAFNRGRKKEFYPNRRFLRALHEFGGKIIINSDAHQKELLNGGFTEAQEAAKECGFREVFLLGHDEGGTLIWREERL